MGWESQVTSCSYSTCGATKEIPKPSDADQGERFFQKGQTSKGASRWYLLTM